MINQRSGYLLQKSKLNTMMVSNFNGFITTPNFFNAQFLPAYNNSYFHHLKRIDKRQEGARLHE